MLTASQMDGITAGGNHPSNPRPPKWTPTPTPTPTPKASATVTVDVDNFAVGTKTSVNTVVDVHNTAVDGLSATTVHVTASQSYSYAAVNLGVRWEYPAQV